MENLSHDHQKSPSDVQLSRCPVAHGLEVEFVPREPQQGDEREVLVGHELLGDGRQALLHWGLILARVLEMERRCGDEGHELNK